MRVLAQLGKFSFSFLGYRRLKYPGLTCKETALKFIAISLKAYNQNKDAEYRQKYKTNLSLFLKHCGMAEEIKEESIRRCIF
jgi:adenylate/nucleoside-diphosphate kinase